MPAAEARRVCISVHDVAPATWPECQALLELIDGFGRPPVTLLVVPDYHHRGCADADAQFMRAIDARVRRGDEVALHGYSHLDDAPAPRAPVDWFRRRVFTRAEGEFAALAAGEAEDRIHRGIEMLRKAGWPVHGFVPPAWLLGAGARAALGRFGFSYTTTRTGLYRLPSWQFTWSPSLVFSVGAAWRHAMACSFDRLALASSPGVLRISLHPVDAGCPAAMSHWRAVLGRVMGTHEPLTKAQWAAMRPMEHVRRAA
jgi:uncharacterized protein